MRKLMPRKVIFLALAYGAALTFVSKQGFADASENVFDDTVGGALENGLTVGLQRDAIDAELKVRNAALASDESREPKGENKSDQVNYTRSECWTIKNKNVRSLYLYFSDDHLVARCTLPDWDAKRNPAEVFEREIRSGRQHPPMDSSLLKEVKWGEEVHAKDSAGATFSLRCGIYSYARDSRLAKARFLVFVQNMSQSELRANIAVASAVGRPCEFRIELTPKGDGLHTDVKSGGFKVVPTAEARIAGKERKMFADFRLAPRGLAYWSCSIADIEHYESVIGRCYLLSALGLNATVNSQSVTLGGGKTKD
jgi:hypothetical protein